MSFKFYEDTTLCKLKCISVKHNFFEIGMTEKKTAETLQWKPIYDLKRKFCTDR